MEMPLLQLLHPSCIWIRVHVCVSVSTDLLLAACRVCLLVVSPLCYFPFKRSACVARPVSSNERTTHSAKAKKKSKKEKKTESVIYCGLQLLGEIFWLKLIDPIDLHKINSKQNKRTDWAGCFQGGNWKECFKYTICLLNGVLKGQFPVHLHCGHRGNTWAAGFCCLTRIFYLQGEGKAA